MNENAPRSGWRRWRRSVHHWLVWHRPELIILLLVLSIAFLLLLPTMLYSIPAGHVGVHWKRFAGGTVTSGVFTEGVHAILPWDRVIIYDARLQQETYEVQVLSADGLHISVDLTWRFRIRPTTAGMLHKYVGPDYRKTLVAPTVGARARDVISVFSPHEFYTEDRMAIQNEISEAVRYDLAHRFDPEGNKGIEWFAFEDILIKNISLPPGVQEAIVRKNAAYHDMQMYSFLILKEQKEAERKRVEAVGIRNFQEIVSNGMSDAYLRWRGIEATLELAKSPNAKVVVVGGGGKNSLPLILNTDGASTGVKETVANAANAAQAANAAAAAAKGGPPVALPLPPPIPPLAAAPPLKKTDRSTRSDKSLPECRATPEGGTVGNCPGPSAPREAE